MCINYCGELISLFEGFVYVVGVFVGFVVVLGVLVC